MPQRIRARFNKEVFSLPETKEYAGENMDNGMGFISTLNAVCTPYLSIWLTAQMSHFKLLNLLSFTSCLESILKKSPTNKA